ncbi:hypothetical protein [Candidatus Magnetobacterium casense]|uniref:Type II secretion system protein GspE N-terminal domain-containing protein n=1 Tax=Candidatus Magnetobacterium casense TaxID=1455061 RepID=A0ABS6S332_9BACT|nr:hypothetical protein [Candidatus Magnetobacterium casensis]MBV6343259.1 hypothetical protein [Candidatus Magnetobacterium casensis]
MVLNTSEKLGDILVRSGLIDLKQLQEALEEQKKTKKRLGIILCQKGWIKEEDIVKAFSTQLGIPYVDLRTFEPDHVAMRIIPQGLAKRYLTLPMSFESDRLSVAMADPLDDHLLGAIRFATGKEIKTNVATTTDIRKAIIRFYDGLKVQQLGDILIKAKVITGQQLDQALEKQRKDNRRLGDILVSDNVATEKDIVLACASQLGFPYKELRTVEPNQDALQFIPEGLARTHLIIPLSIIKRVLIVAMANPLDINAINSITIATGMIIKVVISTQTEINETIDRFYNTVKTQCLGAIPVNSDILSVNGMLQNKTYKKLMLGDILVAAGLVEPEHIRRAIEIQKNNKKRLGNILIEEGCIREKDLASAISLQLSIPFIELNDYQCQPEALKLIPEKLASKHLVMPLCVEENLLYVAITNPLDREIVDILTFASGKKIKLKVSTATDIRKGIVGYYHKKDVKRLGDILVDAGLITEQKLTEMLALQRDCTKKLGELLIEHGVVSENDISMAFSTQLGIPFVDLTNVTPDIEALELIPEGVAKKNILIPLEFLNRDLTITMANPMDILTVKEMAHLTGKQITVKVSTPSVILNAISRYYRYNNPLKDIELYFCTFLLTGFLCGF